MEDSAARGVDKPIETLPGAVVVKTSYPDNPALSEELRIEIAHLRTTDPDEFEHVYEGMCRQAVQGAVFC